jgi:tripeptide aminopeptidase
LKPWRKQPERSDLLKINRNLLERILNRTVEIQQIPAPTFSEKRRAEFISNRFIEEGLQDVTTDELGNVYGRVPGTGEKKALVVSAHSDTVFPHDTDLSARREDTLVAGPGIGDNSLGVAGLFGLVWMLEEQQVVLPGDLWLVANVGEEGLGDLAGMKAVVNRFGEQVLGYIIVEGMALGQVYHHALEVQRYRVSVNTSGGHSWVDYGRPSAIHVIAGLITQLTDLQLPEKPRTTLNVGIISGGTSVNTIASHAEFELDLRSEDGQVLIELVDHVGAIIQVANQPDVEVTSSLIGMRPSGKIDKNHPLVQLAVRSLDSIGIQPRFYAGSTDANIPLSKGLPAICLGLSTGCGAHTLNEYIHIQPIEKGLAQLYMVVQGAYQIL